MNYCNESRFIRILISLAAVILVFVYLAFVLEGVGRTPKRATVKIGGETFDVELARDSSARQRGLSRRDSIPEFGGMLFQFPAPDIYPFWMKDMRFPLDIIWLERGRVVFFVENAEPPPAGTPDSALPVFTPDKEAEDVLEVRAGTVARLHISLGDEAIIEIRE